MAPGQLQGLQRWISWTLATAFLAVPSAPKTQLSIWVTKLRKLAAQVSGDDEFLKSDFHGGQDLAFPIEKQFLAS